MAVGGYPRYLTADGGRGKKNCPLQNTLHLRQSSPSKYHDTQIIPQPKSTQNVLVTITLHNRTPTSARSQWCRNGTHTPH